MFTLFISALVVAGLGYYLVRHDRQHDAEYLDRAEKIEREIQASRDRAMFQGI